MQLIEVLTLVVSLFSLFVSISLLILLLKLRKDIEAKINLIEEKLIDNYSYHNKLIEEIEKLLKEPVDIEDWLNEANDRK